MTAPRVSTVAICLPVLLLLYGCTQSRQSASHGDAQRKAHQAESEVPRDRPPTAKTLYSMAEILATQGKDTECEFVLRRCVQEYPRFIPAYNSLAELQMRQGRIHEAIDSLTTALKIHPRDPVLSNNLGMCRLLRKEYDLALARFTDAAGLVPESEKYRANMATALALLGRQEESLSLLQQILPRERAEYNAEILRKAYDREAHPAVAPPPA